MAVSYKKLLHLMIEKDITNANLMKEANISANIIKKIKTGTKILNGKSLGETNILNGYVVLQTHKVGKFILAQMMMAQ